MLNEYHWLKSNKGGRRMDEIWNVFIIKIGWKSKVMKSYMDEIQGVLVLSNSYLWSNSF